MDVVVSDNVAVTEPQKHPGHEGVNHSAVVDVIVLDIIKDRVLGGAAHQADPIGSRIANLIATDTVADIVSIQIDGIAAHGVEMVVLDATVLGVLHV